MASDLQGSLLVQQGKSLPFTPLHDATQGGVWACLNGTAAVPLAVLPTTLCIGEFYNNTSAFVFEVESIEAFRLLGTAAVNVLGLWACVTAPKTAPSNGAVVVGSLSGRTPYTTSSSSRIIVANGTTVIASGWRPWGPPVANATEAALPGSSWSVPVDGKMIVPPSCSLALTVVGEGATGTAHVGMTWKETPLAKISY